MTPGVGSSVSMPQTVWSKVLPWPPSDINTATAITDTMAEPAFIRKHNRSPLHPPMSSGLTQLASQTSMVWSQWNTCYRVPGSELSLE